MKQFKPIFGLIILSLIFAAIVLGAGCTEAGSTEQNNTNTKAITDMSGHEVMIPADPQHVAIIDKGLVVQTMIALGVDDRIAATGGVINPKSSDPTRNRDTLYLRPDLLTRSNFGYAYYGGFNFETLLAAEPDLVIWHMLDNTEKNDATGEFIEKIESAGIPVVIVKSAGVNGAENSIETQYEAIRLIGEIFDAQDRANAIVGYINTTITMVQERTANIPDDEKPSVLIVGLAKDGSAYVWGEDYGSARFSTEIAHLKNVYLGNQTQIMSKEQIIAFKPDKLVVVDGPIAIPAPEDFYTLEGFESWSILPAVENHDIVTVGICPWWGDFCLEFPTVILLEAKSTYPDQFEDVKVNEWLTDYHTMLYGINATQATELADKQYLKWTYDSSY
ncbi:iron complex transport system substrate-binding protein [Methanofollis sp. W23]|nr:iron complex transport system substrate-binding protein [Methanofollis sp. W23]